MRLIDADKFKEFIRKNCTDSLVDLWCELVRRQPTIEAVPVVHGEWEVNGVNPHNMTIGNWRCTACDGISLKDSNFCPNCGAMMKGGTE